MKGKTMIEIHEYNPNLQEVAERILLGPQAEIQEKVSIFNRNYGSDVGITPTFRWKPGTGDKVKEIYSKWIASWNMKYNGIYQFFKRIDNRQWQYNNLKRSLNDIESQCKNMRTNGLRFQDNSEAIEDAFTEIKSKIIEEIDSINKIYKDQVVCQVEIEQYIDDQGNGNRPDLDKKLFIFTLPNTNMKLISHGEEIASIQLYPTEVMFESSLMTLINVHLGAIIPANSNRHAFIKGRYADPGGLEHPFMPRYGMYIQGEDGRSEWKSVCLGSMNGDILQAASSSELLSMATLLVQWNSRYDIQGTHPHNQYHEAFYGLPKNLEEVTKYFSKANILSKCGVTRALDKLTEHDQRDYAIRMDNTCERINCTLKNECNYWNNVKNASEDRIMNVNELYYVNQDVENLYSRAFNHYKTSDYQLWDDLDDALHNEREEAEYMEEAEQWNPEEEAMTDEERTMNWIQRTIERNNR